MLFFNDILTNAGIDPKEVQLVRHQDGRGARGRSPYSMWKSAPEDFDLYQRMQSSKKFKTNAILASFLVPPSKETLFLGLYSVRNVALSTRDLVCPLRDTAFKAGSIFEYQIDQNPVLRELSERLVIDWGGSPIQWAQYAANQNKPIVELRRTVELPLFPKFRDVRISTDDVWSLPSNWQSPLSTTGGVYLLVSNDGAQYVGSATGSEGFLARWREYAENGHGGNKRLKDQGRLPYSLSILETVGDAVSREEVVALENFWKVKLGSRAHGLNGN